MNSGLCQETLTNHEQPRDAKQYLDGQYKLLPFEFRDERLADRGPEQKAPTKRGPCQQSALIQRSKLPVCEALRKVNSRSAKSFRAEIDSLCQTIGEVERRVYRSSGRDNG